MFDQTNYAFLKTKLFQEPYKDYPYQSRVHRLRSFESSFFVKRDDELGFGISGTKYRKYRTLIPYLKPFKEVVVLGGPFSNHVLGISQLLLENGIEPTLFLKGSKPDKKIGNYFFLSSLLKETSFHWVPNQQWYNIHNLVSDYASSRSNIYILPEGGTIFPSFLGALTLPLDIIRNEVELNTHFEHIFLDVGTGYSAAALLLAFAFLNKQSHCHFLCVAGTKATDTKIASPEEEFKNSIHLLHPSFETWLGSSFPCPEAYSCYIPTTAKSFGSTNATLFQSIFTIAKEEGFFLDPIYSGKLFYHAKTLQDKLKGNVLLVHSGGALSLSGFQFLNSKKC